MRASFCEFPGQLHLTAQKRALRPIEPEERATDPATESLTALQALSVPLLEKQQVLVQKKKGTWHKHTSHSLCLFLTKHLRKPRTCWILSPGPMVRGKRYIGGSVSCAPSRWALSVSIRPGSKTQGGCHPAALACTVGVVTCEAAVGVPASPRPGSKGENM